MFLTAHKQLPRGTYAKLNAELHFGIKDSLEDRVAATGVGSGSVHAYIAYKVAILEAEQALANADLMPQEKVLYEQRLAQEKNTAMLAHSQIVAQMETSRGAVTNLPAAVREEVAISLGIAERQSMGVEADEKSIADQLLDEGQGSDNKHTHRMQKQQQQKELGTQAKGFLKSQEKTLESLEVTIKIKSLQAGTADLNHKLIPYLSEHAKPPQLSVTASAPTPTADKLVQKLGQPMEGFSRDGSMEFAGSLS